MIPNWVLMLNIVLGVFGIYLGIRIFRNQMKIGKGIAYNSLVLIIGIDTQFLVSL
jgi:hypothetical protein